MNTDEMIVAANEWHRARIAALEESRWVINSLELALRDSAVEAYRFQLSTSQATELDLSITGERRVFDRVWRALRANGFVPDTRPKGKEPVFTTWWRSKSHSVTIWMYFSSSECKMVRTGTKMVEQPVYEVQCTSELGELL